MYIPLFTGAVIVVAVLWLVGEREELKEAKRNLELDLVVEKLEKAKLQGAISVPSHKLDFEKHYDLYAEIKRLEILIAEDYENKCAGPATRRMSNKVYRLRKELEKLS